MSTIIPNSTQIPHVIIREWMPLLKDIELRVLLVVADKTLGWEEDSETGRRKEKDWISHYQLRKLIKKKGVGDQVRPCGERSVSKAIATLVDKLRIVEALDEEGHLLDSPFKRMKNGGKIFYRLNLRSPDRTLFDTPAKSARDTRKMSKNELPPQKVRAQKVRATKETPSTEINTMQPENPAAPVEEKEKEKKKPSDHWIFMQWWGPMVERTRRIKPIITGSDGRNLGRILKGGVPEQELERIALFFLADYSFREFSPSISTLCSAGVINGIMNRSKNDPEFWKKLNMYMDRYFPREETKRDGGVESIQDAMKNMMKRFSTQNTS